MIVCDNNPVVKMIKRMINRTNNEWSGRSEQGQQLLINAAFLYLSITNVFGLFLPVNRSIFVK